MKINGQTHQAKKPAPIRAKQSIKRIPLTKPRLKVTQMALARSRMKRRNPNGLTQDQLEKRVNPFAIPQPPPGVVPKGEKSLAQDAAINLLTTWAGEAVSSVFSEGMTFLGYAFLSELAQRGEYRRISEIIADEMTRKWIKLQAKSGDEDSVDKTAKIAQLTDEMERLKVQDVFREVAIHDGFFGRGHIYIDLGDSDDRDELKTDIGDGTGQTSKNKIPIGGLKALRTVEPVWCYPTNYDSIDPLKSSWYNPEQWFVMGKQIHSSRLLKFVGREVPDLLKPAYSFGGLALSQMAKPYVDNWLRTRQSVSDLIHSFSVFVLKTVLAESLHVGGEELFERVEFFNNLRDNQGLMMLDKDSEELENISASLATLDQLQAQALEQCCSITGIPLVKYTGISPHGLNASSEGELRVFNDWLHSYQEILFRKNLWRIIRFTQLSLWGEIDPDITFEFEPLHELNEKEEAEVHEVEARTDNILVDMGAISPAEVRKRVAADPDSAYASLDVDDVPDLKQEEMEGLQPKGAGRMNGGGEEEDAALDDEELEQPSRYRTLSKLLSMSPEVTKKLASIIHGPEEIIELDQFEAPQPLAYAPTKPMSRKQKLAALLRHNEIADDDAEESRYQILGKLLNRIPVETLVKLLNGSEGNLSARTQAFVKLLRPSTTHTKGIQKLAAILNGGNKDSDPNSRFSKLAYLLGNQLDAADGGPGSGIKGHTTGLHSPLWVGNVIRNNPHITNKISHVATEFLNEYAAGIPHKPIIHAVMHHLTDMAPHLEHVLSNPAAQAMAVTAIGAGLSALVKKTGLSPKNAHTLLKNIAGSFRRGADAALDNDDEERFYAAMANVINIARRKINLSVTHKETIAFCSKRQHRYFNTGC